MRPFLAVVPLLLLVPAATAELTVTVDGPGAPIFPESGTGQVNVTVALDCADAVAMGPTAVEGAITVLTAPQTASYVLVTGPTSHLLSTEPCLSAPTDALQETYPFDVHVSREAPGMVPHEGIFNVTVESGNPAADPLSEEAPFSVEAAPFFLLQPQVEAKAIQIAPGDEGTFQVTLTNFGNVRTRIEATLEEVGGDLDPDDIVLPAAFNLGSPTTGTDGSSQTVEVVVQLPPDLGWSNDQAPFVVTWTPSAADDTSATGEPVTTNLLVHARGLDLNNDAPGMGVPLLVAGLLGAAFVVRRRL